MTCKRLSRLAAAAVLAATVPLAAAASPADSTSPFSWLARIWDTVGSWLEGPAAGSAPGTSASGAGGAAPGEPEVSAAPSPDQAGAGAGDEGPLIDPAD